MHLPRRLLVAGLTAATVTSISSSLLPATHSSPDASPIEHRLQSQYAEGRGQELQAARLTRNELQDAINADELRSRELRPAENASEAVLRALFRKP